jgi:Co/Zn/Cd efflux system component
MEATPSDIEVEDLFNDIQRLKTIQEIHDFHCWSLAGGKYVLSCHVRSDWGEKAIFDVNEICK